MKPQDIMLLCLLIDNEQSRSWSQPELAAELKRSVSTVNASLKRLRDVRLIAPGSYGNIKHHLVMINIRECFLCVRYHFFDHPEVLQAIDDIRNEVFQDWWRNQNCWRNRHRKVDWEI